MFEVKDNSEIGAYLKKMILSKYPSCRQFCIAYLRFSDDEENPDEIRKLTNRLSQIINGKKAIQTYDLPFFSELLGISCEEMLSAGAVLKPINNRRTNYNIAFSKDKNDWIDYLNRKDCIYSYADEFGKTVIDYAIEFKNYDFLNFLVENGYISFVSNERWGQEINFGASTTLKERACDHDTLKEELRSNTRLRTQLIALALENGDNSVLEKFRAREVPAQLRMTPYDCLSLSFSGYYDEDFVDVILHSKLNVFNYFCEEYITRSLYEQREFKWIFPFFDKLIIRAIEKKSDRIDALLDVAIKHNEDAFNNLKKSVLKTAKKFKEFDRNESFDRAIDYVLHDFHINEERNIFSFNCRFIDCYELVATNIIRIDISSNKVEIQNKITKLNELYNKIIDIKNHLIKSQ